MTFALSLFGHTIFQIDILHAAPADAPEEFVRLGLDTDLDEELELDITAQTYGFGRAITT